MILLIFGIAVGFFLLVFVVAQTRNTWPNRVARWILDKAGYKILYTAPDLNPTRVWTDIYDDLDGMARRPIHSEMSVAPPWATRHIIKKGTHLPIQVDNLLRALFKTSKESPHA